MTHEHIPQVIFDWLEDRHFSTLTDAEQEQVLVYFSEEEYNELHLNAYYIRKSIEAGSTSGYSPAKTRLLKTFDNTHAGPRQAVPFLQVFFRIAAVFLLFAIGWLCHYLSGYRHHADGMMADTDTMYITQKSYGNANPFDTIYPGTERKDPTARSSRDYDKMREKRDATEYVPARMNAHPAGIGDGAIIREMRDSGDDSLLKPANS